MCNGEVVLESGGYDAMMAEAWAAQDGDFLDAVREGRSPVFGLVDALPAMRAMAAISATRGGGFGGEVAGSAGPGS